jgi:hypothetical protein
MLQISSGDQTLIPNKLAAVRRELATLTSVIGTVEGAVRTNNQSILNSQLQTNPLNGEHAAVQDSYGVIARVTNLHALGIGEPGGVKPAPNTSPVVIGHGPHAISRLAV